MWRPLATQVAQYGAPAEKKHKKIIYKYIDLHMPVTRKRAGGAPRTTFDDGFSRLSHRRRDDEASVTTGPTSPETKMDDPRCGSEAGP